MGLLFWIQGIITLIFLQKHCSGLEIYKKSYVDSGRYVDGVTSPRRCLDYCYHYLTTTKCWAVDFNYKDKRCFVHINVESCGDLHQLEFSTHYRFMECKSLSQADGGDVKDILPTTPAPNEPPAINIYETIYSETYINGGDLVPRIHTKDDCYIHCYKDQHCKGFDWDFINTRCFFHSEKTVCGQFIHKAGSLHMRLDYACDTYKPQACKVTAIQQLPQGFSRIGGTKLADNITYESCVNLCQGKEDCKAVDWNIMERSCWMYDTDEFVLERDCCLHARKVCNDKPQQDASVNRN